MRSVCSEYLASCPDQLPNPVHLAFALWASLLSFLLAVPPAFWACGFRSKNQDPRLALLLAHVFFNRGPYPYDMNRLAPKVGMPVDADIMTLDSYLRGGELDDIEEFPGHLVMLQRCAMVLSGLALELGAGRLSSAEMLKPQVAALSGSSNPCTSP
eukprot:s262_g6.t1